MMHVYTAVLLETAGKDLKQRSWEGLDGAGS